MAKKKFRAVERIDHNQKVYEPGDPISLEEDHAAPLLAIGHVCDPDAEPSSESASSGSTEQTQA